MRSLPFLFFAAVTIPLSAVPPPTGPYDPFNDPNRPLAATAALKPEETAKALEVPAGFSVELIAGEPKLRQPVAYTLDDRGRLWVLENTNYPVCPGEKKDRILIFEDTKGNGKFDKETVFYDKLTFSSGLAVGFGGVYVGAPPNLLFIPDADGDGKPDGEPQVLLDGWGNEDTHETLNDLTWGPDGWLYGTQGVFTFSKVGAPGTPESERIPLNAAVWRFHPQTKKFERYCEGASNQWGIDWNDHGQAFFAACVIPHIWQCIQGARYERQAGQASNPATYAEIKTIGDFQYEKRAYCGAMVYLGGLFPAPYRDTFFFHDIHMNKMRNERMTRNGSGYQAERADDFVVSKDPWFRGLSPQYGPDGGVFINDWYDQVPCYQQRERVDRSNGRIYKIGYEGLKPAPVDLGKAKSAELVQMQLHANEWYVRHARRLLQERGPDPEVHQALAKLLHESTDDAKQLRALWALHVTGGLTEALTLEQLASASEYVRGWTVQLLCESGQPSPAVRTRLVELAQKDASPLVRLYLASAASRLEVGSRWPLLHALAGHAEDEGDHNLPLMLWYAAEPAVTADFAQAAAFLQKAAIKQVQEFTARRLASLDLTLGTPAGVPIAIQALGIASADAQAAILRGLNAAFKGQRQVAAPAEWDPIYASLQKSERADLREPAQSLAVIFGGNDALEALRKVAEDREAPEDKRQAALESLVTAKDVASVPLLAGVLGEAGPLRTTALRGLAKFDVAMIPATILSLYPSLTGDEKREALATLSARTAWAKELLAAIDQHVLPRGDITAPLARQLQGLRNQGIDDWLAKNWGAVRMPAADKQKEIARLKKALSPAIIAQGDAAHGRALFTQTCAVCHTIFGTGAKIGPELPGAFEDIDYLLQNIVDPNAIIGKDYQLTLIAAKDGQTLTGIVAAQDANTLTLKGLAGQQIVQRADIAKLTVADVSLMPEGLLTGRSDDDVRDLFAYLGRHGQVPMLADPAYPGDYFNGNALGRWLPSRPDAWKVAGGELVGPAQMESASLQSDMAVKNARVSFEIAQRPFDPNYAAGFSIGGKVPGKEIKFRVRSDGVDLIRTDSRKTMAVQKGIGPVAVEVRNSPQGTEVFLNGQRIYPIGMVGSREVVDDYAVLQFEVGPQSELRIRGLRLER